MPRCSERNGQAWRQARRRARSHEVACRLVGLGYALSEIAARRSAPPLDALHRRLAEDDDFRARFEDARDVRRERLVESVLALADDGTSGLRRRRLRIDARKWRVALMDKEAAAKGQDEGGSETDELIVRLEEARKRVERMAAEAANASGGDSG